MRRILKIFFNAEATSPFAVLACLLLAELAEVVSLSAMLPALLSVSGEAGNVPPAFKSILDSTLAALGLEPSLGVLICLVVAALVVKSVLQAAALVYAGFAIADYQTRTRERLLASLFGSRWRFFTELPAGRIANSISVDATQAGNAYAESAKFVAFLVQGFVYLIVAFLASVKFALAGLAAGILLIAGLGKLIAISRRAGYSQVSSTSSLVVQVTDALNNIKPIKSMARSAHFITMFAANITTLRAALKRRVLAQQALQRGSDILVAAVVGITFYTATALAGMTLAGMAVFGIIFFQAITVVRRLQEFLQRASELEAAYDSIERLEALLESNAERAGGLPAPELTQGCSFENVSFSHGRGVTIGDVSMVVPAGAVTVLQGPSGAGKTTLVDLLLGLHQPDAGRILIDGTDLQQIGLDSWRSRIGYVPQELSLLHASLRDNISLGDSSISDDDIRRSLAMAGAGGFVDDLPDGLDTSVGEMGKKLSGGQRQRIALARALVGSPRLLVLDEVTSALDPETEAEICANVRGLAGTYTIIAITHRPAWSDIADRLYRVEEGRVSLLRSNGRDHSPGRTGRQVRA